MIVSAKKQHINEIVSIENNSFSKPWSISVIKQDINKDYYNNWVYIQNQKVLGYIFGRIILDEFHLENIAVHPKYRRNKIGTKLILHVISELIQKKIEVILLEVGSNNFSAQKYYESIGFVNAGYRKNYYGKNIDAKLYNLNLL